MNHLAAINALINLISKNMSCMAIMLDIHAQSTDLDAVAAPQANAAVYRERQSFRAGIGGVFGCRTPG